jgi:hypothetical protein
LFPILIFTCGSDAFAATGAEESADAFAGADEAKEHSDVIVKVKASTSILFIFHSMNNISRLQLHFSGEKPTFNTMTVKLDK